jgi:hypothetical protein
MLSKTSRIASAIAIVLLFSFMIVPTTNVFAQQLNSNLPPQQAQQQLNPNVRDHQTDRIETGKEPSLLPSAQPPTPQVAVAPPTSNQQRLQVSFISIRINNDHDPNIFGRQNDGEWKIGVLVNGQFRDLSAPGSPLGDARGGTTYSLSNIQPIVLNVDKSKGAVVISTIGQEIDGCNFNFRIPSIMVQAGNAVAAYYTGGKSSAAGTALTNLLGKGNASSAGNTSTATGLSGLLGKARTYLPSDYNNDPRATYPLYQYQLEAVQAGINKVCNIVNANDAIGRISNTYGPPTFGVGVHSTLSTPVSDSGRDFVLTYQIRPLQVPLQPVQSQQAQRTAMQASGPPGQG